jgi:hypothetical protein
MASCQVSGLTAGTHSIGGSVADQSGNLATISGAFQVSCGKPQLTLSAPQSFWESYQDYLDRMLSVNWSLTNTGGNTAMNVQIIDSINTNGVTLATPTAIALGDIPAGSSGNSITATVKYQIPYSVNVFKTILYVGASDSCSAEFTYPGPYPGA